MSLQKILYYAHGWHLKVFKTPLLNNTIEAWEHGPVIRVVYDSFKHSKDKVIRSRAQIFGIAENRFIKAPYNFTSVEIDFLKNVFDYYSRYDAYTLSKMTHEKDSPWWKIRELAKEEICLQMKIPDNFIADYFNEKKTTH